MWKRFINVWTLSSLRVRISSCARSDRTLESVTSSSPATNELLWANRSQSAFVRPFRPLKRPFSHLEFRAEKPVAPLHISTDFKTEVKFWPEMAFKCFVVEGFGGQSSRWPGILVEEFSPSNHVPSEPPFPSAKALTGSKRQMSLGTRHATRQAWPSSNN